MLIPIKTKFDIIYNKKNLNYYGSSKIADNLFSNLLESSNNRCMYCGENLEKLNSHYKTYNNIGIQFDKEHTVERKILNKGALEKLTKCKFNFSVACHYCNIQKRKDVTVSSTLLSKLNNKKCQTNCSSSCAEYQSVLDEYKNKNKIITMPTGLNNTHDIVFNCDTLLFEINNKNTYTQLEKNIINNHIYLFLSNIEKICLDDVLTRFQLYGISQLPPKKSLFFNKNEFKSVVADNFLDELSLLNKIQQRIIIFELIKKINRSKGIF